MKKIIYISLAACFALLATSCSSSKVVSSWKADTAGSVTFSKVLVVAMAGNKDREVRDNLEKEMANHLSDISIHAIPSMQVYGPKTFENMSDDEILKGIQENGYDGVMIVGLLDRDQETSYNPGYTYSTPYAVVRSRWMPHYRVLYQRVYNQGYYTETTNYLLEANLYSIANNELEYSAQVKTTDPSTIRSMASDFSKSIVDEMIKQGLGRK